VSSKRNEIFKKISNHFDKASNSLKISLKCHAYLEKSLAFSKNDQFAPALAHVKGYDEYFIKKKLRGIGPKPYLISNEFTHR
jgi:hypothetical protein